MRTYAFVTGRSPELSLEELLTVLEPLGCIVEVNRSFLVFQGDIDCSKIISTLGGTVKIVSVAATFESPLSFSFNDWLHAVRGELAADRRRFDFGLSVYGGSDEVRRHFKARGLQLKKHVKSLGIPSRFVYNRDGVLSSVAVTKKHLIGRELSVLVGVKTYIGLTCSVQDFDAYAVRDRGKPRRNMQRGMLPPKVAQVMLNLAHISKSDRLIDPFCGTGTVLQEALLMGMTSVWGTDKDSAAIVETRENTRWLIDKFNVAEPQLIVSDIFQLSQRTRDVRFDAVVTEPYLGPANLARRSFIRSALESVIHELDGMYRQTFAELASMTTDHARAVIIFPIFRVFNDVFTVGDFTTYARAGWKLVPPKVAGYLPNADLSLRGQLVYAREDQLVAREITVWHRLKQSSE